MSLQNFKKVTGRVIVIFFVIVNSTQSAWGLITLDDLCDASKWHVFEDYAYRVETEGRNIDDARKVCQEYGGDLAMPKRWHIHNFLLAVLAPYPSNKFFFIGVMDSEEDNQFTWLDGTALDPGLRLWASGQPDDDKYEHSNCVVMSTPDLGYSGGWFNEDCQKDGLYEDYGSICQKHVGLPRLTVPPTVRLTTTHEIYISWPRWHHLRDSGEGLIGGFNVYIRPAGEQTEWEMAGHVMNGSDPSELELFFTVSGLSANYEYEISVAAVYICNGTDGDYGPSVRASTKSEQIDTLKVIIYPTLLAGTLFIALALPFALCCFYLCKKRASAKI